MSETMERFKSIVIDNGDEVAIKEPPCILWKADHKNCKGCQYELGCGKYVALLLVVMMPQVYTPTCFEDFQKMETRIEELQDRILKAKTPDELKTIPHR